MADGEMQAVSSREWKMALDAHVREHQLEEKNRDRLADILNAMRVEAKDANDLRLEGMNDLRRQLDRQASTFVTFDKYETQVKSASEVVSAQGKAGVDAINAIGVEVNRRLLAIESKLANYDGKMAAFAFMAALIPTIIGIVALVQGR